MTIGSIVIYDCKAIISLATDKNRIDMINIIELTSYGDIS